jgi:hypothetical protein
MAAMGGGGMAGMIPMGQPMPGVMPGMGMPGIGMPAMPMMGMGMPAGNLDQSTKTLREVIRFLAIQRARFL